MIDRKRRVNNIIEADTHHKYLLIFAIIVFTLTFSACFIEPIHQCDSQISYDDMNENNSNVLSNEHKFCTDAQSLSIGDMNFSSNVVSLELTGLGTIDISPLQKCPSLKELSIGNGTIVDSLSPLQFCTSLKSLTIYCGDIDYNLSDLKYCPQLEKLAILSAHDFDQGFLKELKKLQKLEIVYSLNDDLWQIFDLSNICCESSLQELFIGNAYINDLEPLRSYESLKSLDIKTGDEVKELNPIGCLESLTRLSVFGSYTDISELSGLTSLEQVYLYGDFCDVDCLNDLINLEDIEIQGLFRDITSLSDHTSLKSIYISSPNIKNIGTLASCAQLEKIAVSCEKLTDVSVIRNLQLKSIAFSNTPISDIEFVSMMDSLEEVRLYYTGVTDISVLFSLDSLRYVYYYGDRMNMLQIEELMSVSPDCVVEFSEFIG